VSRILADTSAYSNLRRGKTEIVEYFREADEIFVNPIVLGELRAGFARGIRRHENENELRSFLESPRVVIVPIDDETAVFYAVIFASLRQAGTPISSNDLWIAATAMQYGLQIVTTDMDFRRVGQVIVHCFE
jgi:predicted nucleic acid-binding protein